MSTVVLDASVAAKWFLPIEGEQHVAQAFELLDMHFHMEAEIFVPDLFWSEMGNVFWKAVRARKLSFTEAEEALDNLIECKFMTFSSTPLLRPALKISNRSHHSFYDCLYVALAQSSGTNLITADEKLVNSLGARYPVKWLGAI